MTDSKTEFKYFSPVPGHVVPRFGTQSYLGAKRIEGKWTWFEDRVIRIPVVEHSRYLREYTNAVRNGALKERTEKDFDKFWKTVESVQTKPPPEVEVTVEEKVTEETKEEEKPEETPPPEEDEKPRDEPKKRTRRKKTKKKK